MDYAETERFDDEILNVENPVMQRYLVNGERPLAPEHDTKYMNIMCEYVELRKSDYKNNVPVEHQWVSNNNIGLPLEEMKGLHKAKNTAPHTDGPVRTPDW